ncbi:PAS-domain containing protein [Bradyrhizobium sp. sBnM-33]|uniref:PAS-domain containing protein n=1 Tax=Bradyrhizobium sp. sBnM-33 TaxID=2831780 RepID=UPI001BD08CC3|nr:PAS-domain containing protein [Bradyrhizobium sp. sBnM-33]WOH54288.1 PAS-domain containing protein [Bradyrhizobium sp. sBnM-33]
MKRMMAGLVGWTSDLSVTEKIYGIAAGLMVVTTVLMVMSIQSVRLQTGYRHLQASSAQAAANVSQANGLIYAIVMESRGIYMSTDRAKVKQYGDELLKRNRELTGVMERWKQTVRADDVEQFTAFKRRIDQFIEFRKELVRRAVDISPAAGREWGDNDANRAPRTQLSNDLEALTRIYNERTVEAAALGDQGRYAAFYLFALGLGALIFAALNVLVMRRSVVQPLQEITEATDRIAAGNVNSYIPHYARADEIGRLAYAVQNFRDVVSRNFELEELKAGTAKQRDAAIDQRDRFNDKYQATKWQLTAAINSMPQGLVMLDGKAQVLALNDQYRKLYGLPVKIKAGSSLEEILQHRVDSGLFKGDIKQYLAAIIDRIGKRQPTCYEISLTDGRGIKIHERPMDGGGWVSVQEDVTAQRKGQAILERTEEFLAAIVENIPEGILVKDARNLRYLFVNKAAEEMIGMSRAEIMGKTPRELFPESAAELIERRDRQLLERKQQLETIVDTVDNPVKGRRTIAVRRLQIGGPERESHLFVSMVEDRTGQTDIAAPTEAAA